MLSTVILLVMYVGVSMAVVAYAGLDTLAEYDDDDAIFATLGADVLGLAVGQARDPRHRHLGHRVDPDDDHPVLAHVVLDGPPERAATRVCGRAPRFHTPWFSTAVIAGLSIAWYVPLNILSQNALYDTLSALSLMIAFYYALTGLACAIYYRRELLKSVKNFLFIGVGPLVGAAILGYLFVKSAIDYYDVENSYTGQTILGMGVPFVIGMGFLLLGLVLLVVWRFGGNERFFGRKAFEAVDPQVATGKAPS